MSYAVTGAGKIHRVAIAIRAWTTSAATTSAPPSRTGLAARTRSPIQRHQAGPTRRRKRGCHRLVRRHSTDPAPNSMVSAVTTTPTGNAVPRNVPEFSDYLKNNTPPIAATGESVVKRTDVRLGPIRARGLKRAASPIEISTAAETGNSPRPSPPIPSQPPFTALYRMGIPQTLRSWIRQKRGTPRRRTVSAGIRPEHAQTLAASNAASWYGIGSAHLSYERTDKPLPASGLQATGNP